MTVSDLKRRSKWTKYKIMRKSEELRPHIPRTRRLTQGGLWNIVNQYGDVVVKPRGGSRGYGVIRILAVGSNQYELHIENMKITLKGKEQVNRFIKEKLESCKYTKYIVQSRIPLATVEGRPFDMRVIVQRKNLSDPWNVTGIAVKVAGKGYIVTNVKRSNGMVLPIQTALSQSSLKDYDEKDLINKINRVALLSAEKLSINKLYSNKLIFGFDMGLDRNGRVWVIEANLKPMLSHFRKLKDQTMYQRIMKYKEGTKPKSMETKGKTDETVRFL
jgi:hypothetical protein